MKPRNINVVSLFDGISCAQQALKDLGYTVRYFASEIEPEPMAVTEANHPGTVQLGDVRKISYKAPHLFYGDGHKPVIELPTVDLLIGGSPCQDLSAAKPNREGLKGERSGLFYEYLRILKEIKPKYFVLENVASMTDESRDEITRQLGVEPIMIDAALVSAQERKRYFWTNIPGVEQPKDRGIKIRDIMQSGVEREYLKTPGLRKTKNGVAWDSSGKGYASSNDRARNLDCKSPTVPTARTMTKLNVVMDDGRVARMTYNEVERLQGLKDDYTIAIKSKEKRGGAIGNGFNVEVIKHVLSYMV